MQEFLCTEFSQHKTIGACSYNGLIYMDIDVQIAKTSFPMKSALIRNIEIITSTLHAEPVNATFRSVTSNEILKEHQM